MKTTRRLTDPPYDYLQPPRGSITSRLPLDLVDRHNAALREHGSDSGLKHAFNPDTAETIGTYTDGPYPDGSVITDLAWGRLTAPIAQRVLELDGLA